MPGPAAQAMVAHYEGCLPLECCGLLGGVANRVMFAYPLTNAQGSAVAFTIEPSEHFGAWRHAEANGWDLIGAFHSHPLGPDHLSTTDIALANEPEWVQVLITDRGLRAFVLQDRRPTEIPIQVLARHEGS